MPSQNHEMPSLEKNSALKALLDGRSELAETRLSATAAQIVDRLRIRANHLQQLLDEELDLDSRLYGIKRSSSAGSSDMMNLESLITQQQSQNQSARRREETECWRDLTHVIRELLNAWEGFSRNQAKNRFLSALPNGGMVQVKNAPEATTYFIQNDHYNNQSNNHR